ncbi:hypothetical protein ADA01nite_05140 [Aneurinibacillus danicus]|uniref:Uncharacterized protein n=1 Tax=Aneurinibacillus danicus TaxID=267746 RepID=A0A511V2E0_9BACL|nr:hypothetical protein ADA01nite_05140 [Aneurinibacillus danicus]
MWIGRSTSRFQGKEAEGPIWTLCFSYGIGKYILLYSDKVKYTFPPFVSEKKHFKNKRISLV